MIKSEWYFNNVYQRGYVSRTICDMIRNRSSMDINILNEGVKRYIGNKDKNISLLMKYAKLLKVDKIVRQYLEVLM